MKTGAALSTEPDARTATIEATLEARRQIGDDSASLAVVFASPHFEASAGAVVDAVHEAAGPEALLGCVAEAVVGGSREVEANPAVSVWLASLPSEIQTFHSQYSGSRDDPSFPGWPEDKTGAFLLLCDPYTFPAELLLQRLNEKIPDTLVVGGMASGGSGAGRTRLFLDGDVHSSGAVGARLTGAVDVVTAVSQGCRPIGDVFVVTKGEGNVIFELGGKPPMQRIRDLFQSVSEHERRLMAQGLLVGRVINEYKTEFERGDFLVRGVIGGDPDSGAIAIADSIEVGETVQFHVRDADSADEDLRLTLASTRQRLGGRDPAGALLFTCNGRGSRMFSTANHDAGLVAEHLGGLPTAGFFCAGELGPVGGKNFLHGFTASMALFVPR